MANTNWKTRALQHANGSKYPWRTHIFAPIEYVEAINRRLNSAWMDSGDNLSVPMSTTGREPRTHKAASGVVTEAMYDALEKILSDYTGATAFVVPNSSNTPAELLAIIGSIGSDRIGRQVTIWDCAELLGLNRIESEVNLSAHDALSTNLLLQTVVTLSQKVPEGVLVEAVALPWFAIVKQIERDPHFLYSFAKYHRTFEEFLAGAYERAGFNVILTPQRGDKGRDIIATKDGFGSVRILDQAKAFSPGKLVTHNDVRAMLGVLSTDPNSSKGIITTTSDFQPGVASSEEFKRFMPYRLELKNGEQLREWLGFLSRREHL